MAVARRCGLSDGKARPDGSGLHSAPSALSARSIASRALSLSRPACRRNCRVRTPSPPRQDRHRAPRPPPGPPTAVTFITALITIIIICCCLLQEHELNSHGGHSYSQLHTPGTRYHLTLDLVTLYTPLKTPQNTPVQTVFT